MGHCSGRDQRPQKIRRFCRDHEKSPYQEKKQQELQSLTQQGDDFDSRLQELNAEGNQIVLDLSRYNMTVLNLENLSADEEQRLHSAQQEMSTLEAQLQSEQETMEELKELLEEILPIIQDYFDMVANQTENRAMLHLKNGQLFMLALNER